MNEPDDPRKKTMPENGSFSSSNSKVQTGDLGVVALGKAVEVSFSLRDEEGTLVQPDQESFNVIIGSRQLLPQIEAGLLGLHVGERRKIRLEPSEAFGNRDPAKIVEFDRDEFPPDVGQGDHFEAEQENGGLLVLRILDVQTDHVIVDLNHPLAGQTIEFEFLVTGIRPATAEELDAAKREEERQISAQRSDLLPVGRLLQGRNER